MSKSWFDYYLLNNQFEVVLKGRIDNNVEVIQRFIEEVLELDLVDSIEKILLVVEHTGLYVNHLVRKWISNGGQICLVHASKVSEGLIGSTSFEEKTDDLDAYRIAEYAIRFADKLKLHQMSKDSEVPLKEIKAFESKENSDMLDDFQNEPLRLMKISVKNIDKKIKSIVNKDANLKQLYKLICSVHGVGPITAIEILISTNGFTDFSPSQAKSFSRFCGVVPLPKSSGKFKRKPKITKKANAKMKSLLTTCALSLINTNSDLGRYYNRLRAKGKKHRVVLNAVRNKLILRIFAVVRNQTMYERNYDVCLDKP